MKREDVLAQMQPIMGFDARRIEHGPQTKLAIEPDQITMRPGGGNHSVVFAEEGMTSLSKFLTIPINWRQTLEPQTYGLVATELLSKKQVYTLVLKDQKVVAVTSGADHRTVNPERVLNTIEKAIPVEMYNGVMLGDNQSVTIDIVGDKRLPVRPGDIVQAGTSIAFSPIGTIEPTVQSFLLRLVCTNGATSREVFEQFKFGRGAGGGDGDDLWQWYRQSVKKAYRAIDKVAGQWRELTEHIIPPEDRASVLEGLLREARLPPEVMAAIRAEALRVPPETEYDMMNLITWGTSHLHLTTRQLLVARNVASDYTNPEHHRKVCPVCRSSK